MGTKRNPGPFSAYEKAEPDEPVFTLIGRDPCASIVITFWRKLRIEMGKEDEKTDEAADVAQAMQDYAIAMGKESEVEAAVAAFMGVDA